MKNKSYIHNDGTDMVNLMDTRQKPFVYKFYWNRKKNEFYKQWNLRSESQFKGPHPGKLILEIVKQVEKNSGVKPISSFLTLLAVLFIAGSGLALGFYLVKMGYFSYGGAVIIVSPLLAFFLVIGNVITRGTQVSRLNMWMKKNRRKLNRKLLPIGYKIFHSFNRGNSYCDNF